MSKEIELLNKQLAFWKSQTTCLIKALDVAEQQARRYAELLGKTEEELYGERVERGWIGVEDRQPEQSGRFLAYIKLSHKAFEDLYIMAVLDYETSHGFYVAEGDVVTHWMPLPEAPKGGAV